MRGNRQAVVDREGAPVHLVADDRAAVGNAFLHLVMELELVQRDRLAKFAGEIAVAGTAVGPLALADRVLVMREGRQAGEGLAGQRLALLAWVLLVWRNMSRSGGSYSTAPLSFVKNQPTVNGPDFGPSSGRSKVTVKSITAPCTCSPCSCPESSAFPAVWSRSCAAS